MLLRVKWNAEKYGMHAVTVCPLLLIMLPEGNRAAARRECEA